MIDFRADLDTQAWALLEANSNFNAAFPAGNRIKDDKIASVQRNLLNRPADFRQIRIEVTDAQPVTRNAPHVFAMNSVSYNSTIVDVVVPMTAKIVVKMIFDQAETKANRNAALALVRGIWMARYPKFGLPYVQTFSIDEIKRLEKVPDKDSQRIAVTQTLNFSLRPHLSDLD